METIYRYSVRPCGYNPHQRFVSFKEPSRYTFSMDTLSHKPLHSTQAFLFRKLFKQNFLYNFQIVVNPLVVVILLHARWTELFTMKLRTLKMHGKGLPQVPFLQRIHLLSE